MSGTEAHGTGQHPQHCQHHPQDADDGGTIPLGGGYVAQGLVHIYIYIYACMCTYIYIYIVLHNPKFISVFKRRHVEFRGVHAPRSFRRSQRDLPGGAAAALDLPAPAAAIAPEASSGRRMDVVEDVLSGPKMKENPLKAHVLRILTPIFNFLVGCSPDQLPCLCLQGPNNLGKQFFRCWLLFPRCFVFLVDGGNEAMTSLESG